jgi:heat shock protein HslJ
MKTITILAAAALLMVCCKPSEKITSTATLENTYWKLLEVNGKPLTTPANSREVHIILATGGGLKGFAGCNGVGGNYTVDGSAIKFTVISTKMYCNETMETENYLFSVLENADQYKIKGEQLELYQGAKLLTTFESVYLK